MPPTNVQSCIGQLAPLVVVIDIIIIFFDSHINYNRNTHQIEIILHTYIHINITIFYLSKTKINYFCEKKCDAHEK